MSLRMTDAGHGASSSSGALRRRRACALFDKICATPGKKYAEIAPPTWPRTAAVDARSSPHAGLINEKDDRERRECLAYRSIPTFQFS